jgi:hypothetical protein
MHEDVRRRHLDGGEVDGGWCPRGTAEMEDGPVACKHVLRSVGRRHRLEVVDRHVARRREPAALGRDVEGRARPPARELEPRAGPGGERRELEAVGGDVGVDGERLPHDAAVHADAPAALRLEDERHGNGCRPRRRAPDGRARDAHDERRSAGRLVVEAAAVERSPAGRQVPRRPRAAAGLPDAGNAERTGRALEPRLGLPDAEPPERRLPADEPDPRARQRDRACGESLRARGADRGVAQREPPGHQAAHPALARRAGVRTLEREVARHPTVR